MLNCKESFVILFVIKTLRHLGIHISKLLFQIIIKIKPLKTTEITNRNVDMERLQYLMLTNKQKYIANLLTPSWNSFI